MLPSSRSPIDHAPTQPTSRRSSNVSASTARLRHDQAGSRSPSATPAFPSKRSLPCTTSCSLPRCVSRARLSRASRMLIQVSLLGPALAHLGRPPLPRDGPCRPPRGLARRVVFGAVIARARVPSDRGRVGAWEVSNGSAKRDGCPGDGWEAAGLAADDQEEVLSCRNGTRRWRGTLQRITLRDARFARGRYSTGCRYEAIRM